MAGINAPPQMATLPDARWTILNYSEFGKEGTITMKLGDFKYLRLPKSAQGAGAVPVTFKKSNYQRQIYPGGPSVNVRRQVVTALRQRGSQVRGARTEKKLILKAGGDQTTVYYTGTQLAASRWLESNMRRANVIICNRNGRPIRTAAPDAADLPTVV